MKSGVLALVVSILIGTARQPAVAGENTGAKEVTIDNFSFRPQTLVVRAGTAVTWVNRDDVPHTVLSRDKKTLASPALDTDAKFSYTFTVPGTNDYYCSIHPHMKGRIIVQAAN